ncbi:MAG: type IV pilus modification protein PilV, partial [Comamonadaceae bacterium]
GMQVAALKANREARIQSVAAMFATEIADLMRSNQAAGALPGPNPYLGDFTSPLQPAIKSYCLSPAATASCANALEIANAQMTDWLARVDAELPGARVQICADIKPFDNRGLPQWDCMSTAGATTVVKIGWVQASNERWKGEAFAFDRRSRPSIVVPFVAPGAGA